MPGRCCRKVSLIFRQIHLHGPQCPGNQFIRRDITTHTSVRFLPSHIVDQRTGSRCMTNNTEVELDTTRCPGTAHGYITKLHDMVIVDKLLTGRFIHGSPYFSTYLGKKSQFDIIIFKRDYFPLLVGSFSRKTVKTEIRIEQIGRISHRIRIRERIGFNRLYCLGYSRLLCKQRLQQRSCKKKNENLFHGNSFIWTIMYIRSLILLIYD